MKRKIILALLIATTLSFTACGSKPTDGGGINTTDQTETVEDTGEEDEEVGVEIETNQATDEEVQDDSPVLDGTEEDDMLVEPEVEVGTSTVGDLDLEAFEADEAKDHQFGDIGYVATYRDYRGTTGLNSTSTDDVWQYLNEDGTILMDDTIDALWEYGVSFYTGRWAYPTITEGDLTKDLYLYDWTDSYVSYLPDDTDESASAILICTGYDVFNAYTGIGSGMEATMENVEFEFEKYKDIEVNGETYEVYSVQGDETSITYLYKLGGFSTVIEFVGEEYIGDDDALIEMMSHIVL